jgi:hypothetical protein
MAICSSERYGHHKQEQRVLLLRTIVKGSWYDHSDMAVGLLTRRPAVVRGMMSRPSISWYDRPYFMSEWVHEASERRKAVAFSAAHS